MPRIKLMEQGNYKFQYRRKIHNEDLNYAGHLGNDRLITIIQEARIEMFKELGFTELDLGDGSTGIIIGDLVVNFRTEIFSGDELLIETSCGEVKKNSMRLFYRASRVDDGIPVSYVETGIMAFDYEKRAITKWPEVFLEKIRR